VFLSNNIKDTTDALRIYRQRDIVEKAFDILKNITQDQNIAVHSNCYNKLFIGFLSLILTSQIHKTMTKHNLYKQYTIKELYFIMKSLKKCVVDDYSIYMPISAKQKEILDKFECPYPEDSV
jgi:transposase